MRVPTPAMGGRPPLVTAGCLAVAFWACSGPTDPPAPPGGGSRYVLDYEIFRATVDPILTAHGCDDSACHGGGIRGSLALSPPGDKDPGFDFEQVSLQVDGLSPASSPLLTKPLAVSAGGVPHSYEAFASTADADYAAILSWIEAGEFRP